MKQEIKYDKVRFYHNFIYGIRLTTIGRHNDAILLLIDKIRFNSNRGLEGVIEVHIAEDDYKDCDYWMLACEFGDDEEYIYNNIIW